MIHFELYYINLNIVWGLGIGDWGLGDWGLGIVEAGVVVVELTLHRVVRSDASDGVLDGTHPVL